MQVTPTTRPTAGAALAALVARLAPAVARAQAISPADYLPLGQGFQWQHERVAGSGQSDLHLEVTDVNVTDPGTRYFLEVPSNGVNLGLRLEYPAEKTDTTVIHVEPTSTSAADFAVTKLKPTLYKREVKKKNITSITADVVEP